MGKSARKKSINRTGFTFYKSYYEIYQQLSDEQKVQFTDAILEHQFTDMDVEDVSFDDAMVNIAWLGIKPNLLNNKAKFLNGSKPKNKPIVSEVEAKPKRSANNENENEKDNVNEKENENVNESIAISLPLNDNTDYDITQSLINQYKELYQQVDIIQEIRKMKGWLMGNPTKRKTRRGVLRFVTNWLGREQDRRASQKADKSDSYGEIDKTVRQAMNKPILKPLTIDEIRAINQKKYDEEEIRRLDVR